MLRRRLWQGAAACGQQPRGVWWGSWPARALSSEAPSPAAPAVDADAATHTPQKPPQVAPPERTYTVFRLNNVARLALVDDLLHVLRASGLRQCTAQDVALNYDAQLRPLRWYLRLPANGAAAAARELNSALAQHVFGGRLLRLEPLPPPHDWMDLPPPPEQVAGYGGRAVLVSGMTDGTTARDVEMFFSDFELAADPLRMLFRHGHEVQAGRSQIAVVRFAHPLDAHRAVMEKHRDLLNAAQVEVNLLQ